MQGARAVLANRLAGSRCTLYYDYNNIGQCMSIAKSVSLFGFKFYHYYIFVTVHHFVFKSLTLVPTSSLDVEMDFGAVIIFYDVSAKPDR